MPGLGALGVTFGDSHRDGQPVRPQARHFHWASTLWHEMNHVFMLTATNHRVPRWFTEGLAVHEETEATRNGATASRRTSWSRSRTRSCCRLRNSIAASSIRSIPSR